MKGRRKVKNPQIPYGGADGATPAAGVACGSHSNSSNSKRNLLSNFCVDLLKMPLNDTVLVENVGLSVGESSIYVEPDPKEGLTAQQHAATWIKELR